MPITLSSLKSRPLESLSTYAVNAHTGFVPSRDPLEHLPRAFACWEEIVPDLSGLLRSRHLRTRINELPVLISAELQTERERERALLLLSVFANACVWGGEEPDFTIPRPIAIPLCSVAEMLQRPPIVHYASMALNNWHRLNRLQPVSADNARMQIQFLGGVDEDWFFMGSIGVELAGAPLLPLVHRAAIESRCDDDRTLAKTLTHIADRFGPVLNALDRMREWCDPHIFYHRVRPFLTGWPVPGAVYQGVSKKRKKYVGGSAGQSSLIQVMDAILNVEHGGTGGYLSEMRKYMPIGHRRFIEAVEHCSCVRTRARAGSQILRSAYNDAVHKLDQFRGRHRVLAEDYVRKPSGRALTETGTGATLFVNFLREAQLETSKMKL